MSAEMQARATWGRARPLQFPLQPEEAPVADSVNLLADGEFPMPATDPVSTELPLDASSTGEVGETPATVTTEVEWLGSPVEVEFPTPGPVTASVPVFEQFATSTSGTHPPAHADVEFPMPGVKSAASDKVVRPAKKAAATKKAATKKA
jgi:hypothetical protein